MINDELIIRFLAEAGDKGLSKDKLARHIFNAENDFFSVVEYDVVKRQVDAFIRRNSSDSYTLLELVKGQKDVYRLNSNSPQFTQLSFDFQEEVPQTNVSKEADDQSLELKFE